jgi:endo-1,4-beta-xylanase
MKILFKTAICAMALALSASSVSAKAKADGLKDAYKKYFTIGVALNPRNISNPEQIEIIKKNFNSVTAENVMKPGEIHPAADRWNFTQADALADFCRQNGIKMRGHCLVWHSQFANWMFNDENGQPVSKEVFYERLKDHINVVMNRYKDVVYAWDVVNEAMSDDPGKDYEGSFRRSQLYRLCGDEFIAKAFQFAHEADPNAVLVYNDYNAANPHKTEYIYNMVKKMQENGVPINGIGMQGHYNIYDNPTIKNFEAAIKKYSELVDNIHITEFDIRVNKEAGGQLQFSRQGVQITEEIKKMQEEKYANLFEILRKYKKVVKNVTFWNLGDRDSWLGAANYPLPFDENYQPKSVYYVIRDFKK